jgi:hypothetical protein
MFTRNAEPVSVWQSVQWQMVSALGSTFASKVISPQWQCPSKRQLDQPEESYVE